MFRPAHAALLLLMGVICVVQTWRNRSMQVVDVASLVVASKRRCEMAEDLLPGKVVSDDTGSAYWEPSRCVLDRADLSEMVTCMNEKKLVLMGDSIAEQMSTYGRRALNSSFPFLRDVSSQGYAMKHAAELRAQKTSLVLFSMGLWDVGVHFCGLKSFYYSIKNKIKVYKAALPADTMFVIHNLQYINGKNPVATACNPQKKLEVYRDMISLVASCSNITHMTTYDYSASMPDASIDGVHYSQKVQQLKMQTLTHIACKGLLPEKPQYPSCTPQMESDLLMVWEGIEEATRPNEGCPQKLAPLTCREVPAEKG
eukprot:TRINITY_DN6019_c0_g1_i1.p1 TRINITY_DN6019_c0_g1~~TRINITY_DN6019_c0_g1_i1.p1  ORF type:complete len:313 (+),score=63.12 TRINITY_DN6019_c0_g1_i1:75-1013(+)